MATAATTLTDIAATTLTDIAATLTDFSKELNEELAGLRRQASNSVRGFNRKVDYAVGTQRYLQGDVGNRVGLIGSLKKMTPVGLADAKLLRNFMWIAIMLMAFKVAFEVGSVLLHPLICLLFDKVKMGLAMLFVFPVLAYNRLDAAKDRQTRFKLLVFAVGEGIALGHTFNDTHLDMPLSFVLPLAIALFSSMRTSTAANKTSRLLFLGTSLGLGFACSCLMGLLMDKLSLLYALMALADTGIGFYTLQFYIGECGKAGQPPESPHKFMLSFVYSSVVLRALFLALFGSYAR